MSPSCTLLHLSLISGIGPTTSKKLAQVMLEKNIDLYALTVSDFMGLGFGQVVSQKLVTGLSDTDAFEKEGGLLEKTGIYWTTLVDAEYPQALLHTYAPPPVLYWQGAVVWNDRPLLSVVGSRDGTLYGRRIIETVLAACVQEGMGIVSGGARGIDTMAHEFTVAQGGVTVVVLGSGLLRPYPASNKKLFLDVMHKGGAVVSCFPLQKEAQPWQFPVRNRIIAGMARGCLVVQAAHESGALITANYALNEGRNVYAVPGHFDDPLSAGCHQLLTQGAQITVSADVILQDYGLFVPGRPAAKSLPEKEPYVQKTIVSEKKIEKKLHPLVSLCTAPISFDELVERTQRDENELKLELFELQLNGMLQQDFAGLWSRT